MTLYSAILTLLQYNLIRGCFITVLVILLAKTLFGKYVHTNLSVKIIKWILITYAVLSLIYTLTLIAWGYFGASDYIWLTRATGPYWWAYWSMLSGNCIFPLFLLIPRLGRNIYIILLASILMNLGWLLELLTIYMANRHRDYIPAAHPPLWYYAPALIILLQGFLVGVVLIGIEAWWGKRHGKELS